MRCEQQENDKLVYGETVISLMYNIQLNQKLVRTKKYQTQ